MFASMAVEDQKTLRRDRIIDLNRIGQVVKKRYFLILLIAGISGIITYFIKASEEPQIEVKIKLIPNTGSNNKNDHYHTIIHDFFNYRELRETDSITEKVKRYKSFNHIEKIQFVNQTVDTSLVHFKITYNDLAKVESSVDEFLNISNEYLSKMKHDSTYSKEVPFYSFSNTVDPFYVQKIKENNPLKAGIVIFIIALLLITLSFVFIEDIKKPIEN